MNPQTLDLKSSRSPAGVPGHVSKWSWVDSNHRSSSCKEAAFAAGLQDRIKLKMDTSGIAPPVFHNTLPGSVCRTDVYLLDHEPEYSSPASGSRGTRTHKRDLLAACFQAVFSYRSPCLNPPYRSAAGLASSRMTSVIVKQRELESNQRLRVQSPASLPAATIPQ